MDNLDKIKILLGIAAYDEAKDSLLNLLLAQAKEEFLQYTNCSTLPLGTDNVIIDMAVIKYNLIGTEGLASQSFSGSSEAYANYPPQLIKAMNRYRKVRFL